MRTTLVTLAVVALVSMLSAAQQRPAVSKTSPVLMHEVHPDYTDAAKARRIQGTVEMAVVVKTDGTVGDARVTKSLDQDLDQQALKAVRQWTFKPGTLDGKAVDVEVAIEMTFTLRDGPVYKIGDGVKAPQATRHPNPTYTQAALQSGIHGTVELSGIVETDGSITSIKVVKGLDDELDQQAIDALKRWHFAPGQKDGVDVRVEVKVEMTFTVK